ncbi:stage II sporulation protein M [Ornithinibacillus californiensis]|uniref:stage II sporulation protein M n=1 Tax=Ornithinibacillus californiensis TaxID=161536 RepID=UPI00064DC1CF|nr:stage II sporulation protein M [Ornithinibacillus californiensis]
MDIKQFIKLHREDWKQLENYIRLISKSRKNVTSKNIAEFDRLYQKASQHLSYSQTYFPNEDVTFYINELVGKSHNLLYKNQVTSGKQIRDFFSKRFIGLLLEQWKFIVVSALLFFAGGLAGFLAVADDPLHIYSILPADISQGVDPERLGEGHDSIDSSLMSAEIMTNNIQVAILAFASGITFGILTIYLLVFNGLLVGALAGLFWHYGMTYEFWAYIVPHGMIELTAIFIAGGAGLIMGYRLFVPGPYSRIYQLKYHGKRSVLLFLGTVPLFVIAGIIEGFITPAAISLEAKYIVAGITVIGMIAYIALGKVLLDQKKSKVSLDS